ncbi:hypothetical protein PVAP13_5KG089448 [Panicum virgatum]|uniref:Uncharacterized protein n=1 Tax=Panicum virgatum TaxID=38727 RepID=A0A8T0SF23_PANVG|nr:hypothetical protein PVAP13_5KG089448 [Panicum virgatum]
MGSRHGFWAFEPTSVISCTRNFSSHLPSRAACSLPIASPPSVTNSVVAIDVFQKPAQESASLVRFAPGRAPEQAISQDNRRVCALLVCLPISARESRVVFVV